MANIIKCKVLLFVEAKKTFVNIPPIKSIPDIVQLSPISVSPSLQTLSVTVCQAMELPAMDMGRVSDPYVKVWTPGSQDMPCTLVEFDTSKGNTRLALFTYQCHSLLCTARRVFGTLRVSFSSGLPHPRDEGDEEV